MANYVDSPHPLLQPNTISKINQDNYKATILGQGSQASVWLVVNKAFYAGERDPAPQGANKTASAVRLGLDLCIAKAEAIGAVTPLSWDLKVMRRATCQAAAARGYTSILRAADPINGRWYTASYEGVSLTDVFWPALYYEDFFPMDLIWTVTHQLAKMVYFLQTGVESSDQTPVPGWSPIVHGDIAPFNVTCKMVKGRLQLSLIDWGRALIPGAPNHHGKTYQAHLGRVDTAGIAKTVHWLIHNQPLDEQTRTCKCTDEELDDCRWMRRSKSERAKLKSFIKYVLEPLCCSMDIQGQRNLLDTLSILENPSAFMPVPSAGRIKPMVGLTTKLRPWYKRKLWDEKSVIKKIEPQYRQDRGMRVNRPVATSERARPPTRANPAP